MQGLSSKETAKAHGQAGKTPPGLGRGPRKTVSYLLSQNLAGYLGRFFLSMYTYLCTWLNKRHNVCTYIHVRNYMYNYILYAYIYACIHIYIHTCVYIYIYSKCRLHIMKAPAPRYAPSLQLETSNHLGVELLAPARPQEKPGAHKNKTSLLFCPELPTALN